MILRNCLLRTLYEPQTVQSTSSGISIYLMRKNSLKI